VVAGGHGGDRRAVVVLPTPPGPQAITISLEATNPSSEPPAPASRLRGPSAVARPRGGRGRLRTTFARRHQTPALRSARPPPALSCAGRRCARTGTEEQDRVDGRGRSADARGAPSGSCAWSRPGALPRARAPRRHPPPRSSHPRRRAGGALRRPLLGVAEELGSTRFTTTPASRTVVSAATRAASSRVSETHLLGRRHRNEPGLPRVGEDVEHPVGLRADEAHLDQLVDGCGAASWLTMCPDAAASTTTRS